MKRKILLMLALAGCLHFAQAQEQSSFFIKNGDIKHISLMDDMDVVLISGNSVDKGISVGNDVMENLDVRLEGETLEIFAKKQLPAGNKYPLYIHVNGLEKLTVSGNVNLKTWGVINTGNLDLFVNGNAKVQVRVTGKINAYPVGDTDIKVKYILPVHNKKGK
jgi:hypothetical protein